jgi:UDP-galactopyranose mutase
VARIVVVGAGLGGLAAAARLAKLGHRVVLIERTARSGGALRRIEAEGYAWDAGPTSTSLPAVLRDLFRKSGRPIERYVDLQLRDVARRHVFADGSSVDLPTGSRAAQSRAIDAGLGPGAGAAWTAYVDALGATWETLRRLALDDPAGGERLSERSVGSALRKSTSLRRLLLRSLPDERLRAIAATPFELAGSSPRDVPAFAAVDAYVERTFGVWSPPEGMAGLAGALTARLEERDVELRLESPVVRIAWDPVARRVDGVTTEDGREVAADAVVCDADPRRALGQLLDADAGHAARRAFERATPAAPPSIAHVGLIGGVPELPDEVVLHGDPLIAVHTSGHAPNGAHAWTIHRRGAAGEDVLVALARRGVDVRDQVAVRIDRSPADIAAETGGSPYGMAWDGYRAHARRARHANPVRGLFLVGAGIHPGPGIPYVAWGAAHVAARIGPAASGAA